MKPMAESFPVRFDLLRVFASFLPMVLPAAEPPAWLDAYNVTWTEPGTKALHSMPCGGGNVALNVWTTKDALLFYIASPDSWDGQTQVKMGRVRLTLSPNPFSGTEFRQEHRLADNSIHVSGKAAGRHEREAARLGRCLPAGRACRRRVSDKPVTATAAIEMTGHADGRFDGDSAVWRFRIDGPSPQRREADREKPHRGHRRRRARPDGQPYLGRAARWRWIRRWRSR